MTKMNVGAKLLLLITYLTISGEITNGSIHRWVKKHILLNNPVNQWLENQPVTEVETDVVDLIRQHGYDAENHTIETEDGYLLILHRIPNGRSNIIPGTPVLLLHGLGCHSGIWVSNGYDSLAFMLADEFFDVWMINFRGNPYTNHIDFRTDDKEFWEYSWQDHAEYDLTAAVDYITGVTKYAKVLSMGISLGTTVALALLASSTYYNSKVAGLVALAPPKTLPYLSTLIESPALDNDKYVKLFYKIAHKKGSIGQCPINPETLMTLCPVTDLFFCQILFSLNIGYSPSLPNKTMEPILKSQCCYGTSRKNAVHYAQMKRTGTMARFDYGRIENVLRYGKSKPPSFALNNITSPIAFFYPDSEVVDRDMYPLSIHKLKHKIKRVVLKILHPHKMGLKNDIFWLNLERSNVYDQLISALNLMWF